MGARHVYWTRVVNVLPKSLPVANSTTGLAECDWISPATAYWDVLTNAVSGIYLAKLSTPNGPQSYISFVVRDDSANSDFLFQTAVTTYQAYNFYPGNLGEDNWQSGRSLYNNFGSIPASFGPEIPQGNPNGRQAREVSFNRPYIPDNANIYNSAGQFFRWEYNMVRWLEKKGYWVTYQTDVDTHALSQTLAAGKHKVFLSVGHDEYWSWGMRDNVEQARNRTSGFTSVGFFGANISHWQIRFKPSSSGVPNRTIVGYKHLANSDEADWADPLKNNTNPTDNYLITGLWRDVRSFGTQCPTPGDSCYKFPEDELVGVMTDLTNPEGSGDFEFDSMCPAWVKTGMQNPQGAFMSLLGYEADRIFDIGTYPNRTWNRIGDSDFVSKRATTPSHAVYYRMQSGGRVFGAGTMQWVWGLDNFGADASIGPAWRPSLYNPDIEVVTENILRCLKDGGTACGES